MSNGQEPLIKLETDGIAPVIRYDLPEPTVYSGRNFIELDYDDEFYTEKAFDIGSAQKRTSIQDLDYKTILGSVENGMETGFADRRVFPNIRMGNYSLRYTTMLNPGFKVNSEVPLSAKIADLNPEVVARNLQEGKRLNFYTTMYGTLTYNYIDDPAGTEEKKDPQPRLLLIETYRLSSFLGQYGAGRIVKTFSLLPGERTRASVRTFTKTEEQRKQASSILDSFTEDSSNDFERTVSEEQTDKATYEQNFEYYAEAEAKASWGWGSAKVKGGVKGGSNSSREEATKNINNSVEKHAMKASAKREVEINTSYEVSQTAEEETSIEREIENINLSRTLNFIFRQMNQEFISLLSLVDVRLAFFNGFAETRREYALPDMDQLLTDYIVEDKRDEVRQDIVDALENILDHKDDLNSIIEIKEIDPENKYFRVKKDLVSTYVDPITGTEIRVPGIILSANTNVLRTEGVVVEALLGIGDALDSYATQLQTLEVTRRDAQVREELAKAKTTELINKVVREDDQSRAEILEALTCPCGPEDGGVDVILHHAASPNGPGEGGSA